MRLPFTRRALFHLAHVHLKSFIVDDNKSLCQLAGIPLAALCSADSRWPGKTTEPTPFLGRPEKGVKDKRGSFVGGAFYETRADPRQPLASAPSFEGVDGRGALSDCRKRDAHSFDNTPGVHLATPPTPATAFCRFLERARFIFCAGNVRRGARWALIRGQMKRRARSERRKAVWKLLFFTNGRKCRSTVRDYL